MYQIGVLTDPQPDDPKFHDKSDAEQAAIDMYNKKKVSIGIWDLDDHYNTIGIAYEVYLTW